MFCCLLHFAINHSCCSQKEEEEKKSEAKRQKMRELIWEWHFTVSMFDSNKWMENKTSAQKVNEAFNQSQMAPTMFPIK